MPYVGSRISLISKSEIRYEGILYVINTEESTIALQNVRSYGTEGRVTPEVSPSEEVYDFIIFRGEDIKDLTVLEGNAATTKPSQRAVLEDPAVVSVGPERKVAPQVATGQSNRRFNADREHREHQAPHNTRYPATQKNGHVDHRDDRRQDSYNQSRTTNYGGKGSGKGYGRGYGKGNGKGYGKGYGKGNSSETQLPQRQQYTQPRRPHHQRPSHGGPVGELDASENAQTKALVSEEFDFSKAADTHEKPAEVEQEAKTGYNKTKSFFDSISCDASQRGPEQPRFDKTARDKQREVDKETFGATATSRPFGYSGPRRHNQNNSYRSGSGPKNGGVQSQKAY